MKEKVIHLHELNNISNKDNEIEKHVIDELLELLEVEMNCNQLVTILEDIDFVAADVIDDNLVDIENGWD